MTQASCWYFAYGSNLDPGTLEGRRRIQPLEARRARLDGWRLVFDLPVGPGERAVANVRRDPAGFVHGVAFRLGSEAAAHLDLTEGVHRGYYERIEVRLREEGDAALAAFTYVSSRTRPGRKPSARYLDLILRGARHHGLPDTWCEFLAGLELAVDERELPEEDRGPG